MGKIFIGLKACDTVLEHFLKESSQIRSEKYTPVLKSACIYHTHTVSPQRKGRETLAAKHFQAKRLSGINFMDILSYIQFLLLIKLNLLHIALGEHLLH